MEESAVNFSNRFIVKSKNCSFYKPRDTLVKLSFKFGYTAFIRSLALFVLLPRLAGISMRCGG